VTSSCFVLLDLASFSVLFYLGLVSHLVGPLFILVAIFCCWALPKYEAQLAAHERCRLFCRKVTEATSGNAPQRKQKIEKGPLPHHEKVRSEPTQNPTTPLEIDLPFFYLQQKTQRT
jgi:hypothetical protein